MPPVSAIFRSVKTMSKWFLFQERQRLAAGERRSDVVASPDQDLFAALADGEFVIHHQHPRISPASCHIQSLTGKSDDECWYRDRRAIDLDSPPVTLYDPVGDRQAQAGAAFLGGEEGFKELAP